MRGRGPPSPTIMDGEAKPAVIVDVPQPPKVVLDSSVLGGKMLAGGFAGIMTKTLLAPLDRVRILCQTGASNEGMMGTFRTVIQSDGIPGLWFGNTVNCVRVFPNKALLYMFQDTYNDVLCNYTFLGTMPVAANFFGGGFAGMTASAVTYPLDTIRARQAGKFHSDGFFHIIRTTLRDEGMPGFYRGMKASMIGAMPYEGLKFGFFAFFKPLRPDAIQSNTVWTLTCGALAGALSSTIMYPNDTIRRILQVQGSAAMKGQLGTTTSPKQAYSGAAQAYRDTYQRFGLKRFYRGLGANLIRIVPNTSFQFALYEYGKSLIPMPETNPT
eukprot:m.366388 g.366388  ORF g.366388 m.366388 type:complete len:327 (+) comp28094_c0_seq2:156-1136(+)